MDANDNLILFYNELWTHNAPDICYKALLSTWAKPPLRRGETWKDRVEKLIVSLTLT